ncbi:hypothetical protein GCM10008018_48840 [Paenibacillus marchantiophytorum]|uniref:Uncharacterized protein n=1 Tax=Paenibacillus marchantiophytorum TaxID=1619310 RepID=A0ABQ1F2K5_9BACL|nr:hypothetical protein [Paenibacillus marchantiophytorum]GFZ96628.1 hypothetical protein GCM10008018_48840 [Paenibacillus marchantiophytorum]
MASIMGQSLDERLPGSGRMLEPNWALQHPDDYLEVLRQSVPEVLRIEIHAEGTCGVVESRWAGSLISKLLERVHDDFRRYSTL